MLSTGREKQATIYGFEIESFELFCLFQILILVIGYFEDSSLGPEAASKYSKWLKIFSSDSVKTQCPVSSDVSKQSRDTY